MANFSTLRTSAATIALSVTIAQSGATLAQASPAPSSADVTSATTSASTAPAPAENTGIGDIVVTAQRRTESAEKAPIAISVVSAATIANANVTSLPNLSRLVPSIQIAQAAGATPIYFLRGVGSLSGNSLTDPAVSINYDGVPLARQYQGNGQFYDLERVEVLKGPQGTLYGRNATGGVISLIPTAPKLGETSGYESVSYGNYSALNTEGAVNVALGDQAALRVSYMTANHKGYLNDGEQDQDDRSVRVQLKAKPTDGFTFKIGVDYHHQGGLGGGYALTDQSFFAGNPAGVAQISPDDRVGYLSPRGQAYFAARGRGTPSDPVDPGYNNQFYGVTGQADVDLGFGTLTVIPAYRHADLDYYAINSFSLDVHEHDDQMSIETRIASKDSGRLKWIVGGFALRDDVSDLGNFDNFNGTGSRQNFKANTTSFAGFGDATFDITDRLRALGGVRYTQDHKTADGLQTNFQRTGGFIPLAGDRKFSAVNYRAGFQYDVASRIMFYGTYATGFHSGGFYFSNIVNATDKNTYDPEHIRAITVGLKSKLFDNRLQLDIEAFRWRLNGQQVSIFTQDGAGQIIFPTINAGKSLNQGVQIDAQFRPVRNTTVGAQVQYLDAHFKQLSYIQAIPAQPGILCTTSGAAPALHVDCSGNRPPQAPEWSINLSADQTFDLGSGANLVLGGRGHYQSKTIVAFNYLPDDVQKGVWTEDATLTFNPSSKRWSAGLYVNNISNRVIKSNGTHNANVEAYQLRPPRTYGGRVSVNF